MITIGLAGHIDHGKSALVKRLTGTDPDRLPEEQARGMTIDLGFAHWNSSSDIDGGTNAGVPDVSFVDVPGHERFVRNMIAGAGGIEAALLVVAADDGWMPQSQEHFDIMSLLGLDRGIIAVTKTDLVEPEWVETVIDDIKTRVGGSFLETAPLVPVSSTTGDGFDQLRSNLRELSTTYTAHHDIGKPRLFADRAFILPGMGRVLTGSARGGGFAVGDEVVVYPALATGKVRTLHRHDRQVGSVAAGQRAALSFTGIDSKALARGSVVTKPEFCAEAGEGKFLIARVRVLPDCSVRLSTRRKLSLFLGTSEVSCELRAAGESHLSPGTDSLVALRCSSKPLCFAGDRFILRLPTPQITVGGGVILGWRERVQTREQLEAFREFATEEALTPRGLVRLELSGKVFHERDRIGELSVFAEKTVAGAIDELAKKGEVGEISGRLYLIKRTQALLGSLITRLREKLTDEPHLVGLAPEELRGLLPRSRRGSPSEFNHLLELAVETNALMPAGGKFTLPGRQIAVSGQIKEEARRILLELNSSPFAPPLIPKLVDSGKNAREALGYLFNTDQAVKISSELALSVGAWNDTLAGICERLLAGGELNVAWLRTRLNTSRKYALPLLEETDRRGITTRDGDLRVKGPQFEKTVAELNPTGA